MIVYPIIYAILIICTLVDFSKKRTEMLYISMFALILFVGFRGMSGADSFNYINYFNENTDTITDWKGVEKKYTEYGFYYLSVILKTIWNNIDFYFFVIASITLGMYLKTLKRWCFFPVLSLCVYYARFMILREMNQIRGGLAISIIIFSLFYLVKNERRKYILGVLVAMCFHVSSIIALPMIWIYRIRINLKKSIFIILAASIFGIVIGLTIRAFLLTHGGILALTYIDGASLGITNPVVIFQVLICCIYVYWGKNISQYQKGYSIIRNAYLYSIVILLMTSGLGVIGGRLSTIFATCEIFIFPDLIRIIKPRIIGYSIVVSVISVLFVLNYLKLLAVAELWEYRLSIF